MEQSNKWYKEKRKNKIWWLDNGDEVKGEHVFSFDKIKKYNLFADFPHNLTPEEVEIFIKEEPFWADFFSDRLKCYEL